MGAVEIIHWKTEREEELLSKEAADRDQSRKNTRLWGRGGGRGREQEREREREREKQRERERERKEGERGRGREK